MAGCGAKHCAFGKLFESALAPGKYSWEFIPVEGSTFRDSGSGACHSTASNAD